VSDYLNFNLSEMDIFNHFSKKVALTFLLSIGTFFSYGQENWSMDKFLLHSFQSPAQQFEDQKVELLEDGNYRLPLIENLQFRTEQIKCIKIPVILGLTKN